jgi:hypothetical protein
VHALIGPAFSRPDDLGRDLMALGVKVHRHLKRPDVAMLRGKVAFAISGFGTSL